MDEKDFAETVYSLSEARGHDAELWFNPDLGLFATYPKVNFSGQQITEEVDYQVSQDDDSNNSDLIKVEPGDVINVIYQVALAEDEPFGWHALPILHQFYESNDSTKRKTYCWCDYDVFDETPPHTSPSYKWIMNTNPQQFVTSIEVPEGVGYYSVGFRAKKLDSLYGTCDL
jgi:hypothetical protein